MEGAFRQRNEVSSGASDPGFGTIPLQNSPLYSENELRFSAQQSRIALKASGDIDPTRHVKGYFEMDFLGAATTANMRESNSYTPRIRQAYFAYDDDNWHGHFSAGQMWSLLTQNRVGILNGTENIPLTIDAQYVVGFNWARQPAIRYVQDVGQIVWFGVSVEAPQTAFASNGNGVAGAPAIGTPGVGTQTALATPNSGLTVPPRACRQSRQQLQCWRCAEQHDEYARTTLLRTSSKRSRFDPGWGHYEAMGLQRWFADQVAFAPSRPLNPAQLCPNSWSQKTKFGWGVGGNVLLPVSRNW